MISKAEQREIIYDIAEAYLLLKNLLIFIEGDMFDLEQKIQLKDVVEFVEFRFDDILQKATSNKVDIFLKEEIVEYLGDVMSVLLKFRMSIMDV